MEDHEEYQYTPLKTPTSTRMITVGANSMRRGGTGTMFCYQLQEFHLKQHKAIRHDTYSPTVRLEDERGLPGPSFQRQT